VDNLVLVYRLKNEKVVSKLVSILKEFALVWYESAVHDHKGASWKDWKKVIEEKFGGSVSRQKHLHQSNELQF
jgi:hypothetical protein